MDAAAVVAHAVEFMIDFSVEITGKQVDGNIPVLIVPMYATVISLYPDHLQSQILAVLSDMLQHAVPDIADASGVPVEARFNLTPPRFTFPWLNFLLILEAIGADVDVVGYGYGRDFRRE